VERGLERRDQLLKLIERQAGHIQKLCGAILHVGEPYTSHKSCLLSLSRDVTGASYQKESGINSSIYARLQSWGYGHKSVNHGRGEFARDDDGDGLCEVHVNTMEGFWSLLRSWLRPHRGISQEKLPLYLGFFEFVHNVRKRGKALLPALIELLVT
jgi:hypothetical protein